MSILYVCPFAHYTGHFASSARNETEAMGNTILLTYCGLVDSVDSDVGIKAIDYLPDNLISELDKLRSNKLTQRIAMMFETIFTYAVAFKIKNYAKSFHIRDGEPFPFLIHLFAMFHKDMKFVLSLTGTNLLKYKPSLKKPGELLYITLLNMVNAIWWYPVYKISSSRNKFRYIVQNEDIKSEFENYMGGIMKGDVITMPPTIAPVDAIDSKNSARDMIGISRDAVVLLSFGCIHIGKDIRCILEAIKDMDVILLHGGHSPLSTENNDIMAMVDEVGVKDKVVIYNEYIPEVKKHIFFNACDAVVLSYKKEFRSSASMLWECGRYTKPVIGSAIKSIQSDVVKYNMGICFEPGNKESLKEAIIQCLKVDFNEGLLKYKDDYSIDKWGRKVINIHKELTC